MKKVIAIIGSFMFGFVLAALMSSNKKRGLIDDVEYIPDDEFWNDFDKALDL